MKKEPLLKVGCFYEITNPSNKEYKKIYFIGSVTDHFEKYEDSSLYSYGFTCENTIEGMEDSIHDCGGHIWEGRDRYCSYGVAKGFFRELSYEESVEAASKLRGKWIRKKYGLPQHENFKGW